MNPPASSQGHPDEHFGLEGKGLCCEAGTCLRWRSTPVIMAALARL